MNEHFIEKAQKMINEKLFQINKAFHENIKEYVAAFSDNFGRACRSVVALQNNGVLSKIAYLEYTMLYTNFLSKKYIAEVRVYNGEWYLDKTQMAVEYFDVSFIYKHFDELWINLLAVRKQYVGKVSAIDVSEVMADAVPKFYDYIISLCRYAILDCIETEIFKAIKKAPEFEINVGEYMAYTEAVYKENANKDKHALLEWFAERLQYEYCFEDFSGMDFSGEDLAEIDLRYSDLRNTALRDTDLRDSALTGVRFCGADMEDANLSHSILYEADLRGANLRNAKLIGVDADAAIFDEDSRFGQSEWESAGYFGVNFKNADLRGANFKGSNFIGANFDGADMRGAIFSYNRIGGLNLSAEQLNHIIIAPNRK